MTKNTTLNINTHEAALNDIHEKIKQNQIQPPTHQDPIYSHEIRDPYGILQLRSRL